MSRPSSYHDAGYDDSFSLPLFSSHLPPVHQQQAAPLPLSVVQQHAPHLAPGSAPSSSQRDASGSLLPLAPPPSASQVHQHRHSIHTQPPTQLARTPSSPYSPYSNGAPPSPYAQPQQPSVGTSTNLGLGIGGAGAIPPPTGRMMSSAVPYSSYMPYTSNSAHTEELLPPPTSTSLGSLARSASLGAARRRDPFAYPSDDVESGMASGGDWSSYQSPPYGQRDVIMSPGAQNANRPTADRSMPPPPLPIARQPQQQQQLPPPQQQQASMLPPIPSGSVPAANPYLPRDAPPQDLQWTNRRSSQTHHAHHSPLPGSLSPQPRISPQSPGVVGYQLSSPRLASPQQGGPSIPPLSPGPSSSAVRDLSSHRSHSHSHQSYPVSQPTTPVRYDPPRASARPSRQGFHEIREWSDMKGVVNPHPAGRRADPMISGGYLSPLKCLTAALPQTYSLCNPNFKYQSSDNPRRVLTKPSKPTYNEGADNEDWDYILYVNDVLGGEHGGDRYLILDVLGQGTFGQVVKCQNMRTHDICAVKVVKNKPAYLNQSKMEVAILQLLNREHDPEDKYHILRLLDSFTHKSHLCLVFECLSSNLYELIKQNQFKGLSLQLVKVFTLQLLECLAVLKDARLIHCDLKPENILLKSLQSPQIKVIDFGSACHELQTVYTYIQSRFYRSPEVLLGLPYSTSIDMWSLGCIVVELFLGLPLFPGTSEYNQISRIVDMLGTPPHHLLEVGKQTNEFFNYAGVDAQGRKQYRLKSMDQYSNEHRTNEQPSKQYFKQTKLPDIVMEYPYSKKNAKQSDIDKEMSQRRAFIDFVQGLLNLDPIKRWSPQQAAKHPFITGERFTGPFEPPTMPTKRTPAPAPAPAPTPDTNTSAATTTPKKYGGLVQSPPSTKSQRVYSDAAAYNQQLAQHQYQTAQAQQQATQARQGPFSPGYDQYAKNQQTQRIPSQHAQPPQWGQSASIPQQSQQQQQSAPYQQQQRLPSQTLSGSASHTSLRGPPMATAATTNPPPNSYYPASRNRANTINQMDAIPPALARLTNLGAPDPSGSRSSLTPVLNRDDMLETWERRQGGGAGGKRSSLHHTTHAQLEFLQEQAELAALNNQGYVMPGQYATQSYPHQPQMYQHRASQSMSGSAPSHGYQMQPPIGSAPPQQLGHGSGPNASMDYRSTGGRPSVSDYEPSSATSSSSRSFLPTFPPPAATGGAGFDGFDTRDPSLGIMYTPLQPVQQGPYSPYSASGGGGVHPHTIPHGNPGMAHHGHGHGGGHPHAGQIGHGTRMSFSGPYGAGTGNDSPARNPFAQQQQQQQQPNSPSYPRHGGYGGA